MNWKMPFEKYSDDMVMIGIEDIIMVLTGSIYQIAPRYMPRNVNAIVAKFIRAFREQKGVTECLGHYTIEGKYNEVLSIIQDILGDIPEFLELNLTEREYEYGEKHKDFHIGIVTRYSKTTPRSCYDWYDDFIDLTAFMQNFSRHLWIMVSNLETPILKDTPKPQK